MHGHAPTQRERASRLKHVLALGRRSTSRAPTAANGDASQGTRWMVSGGARWRKPPSGARLTDVTKRSSRPSSSALMEATTCSWASFRLWLGLGCLEMRSVCAACAVRGERAIGHMHMVGAAGKQASHKDETRQRARARLPEQPHGGRGGRVAAGVGRVRTHVLKVQAAATLPPASSWLTSAGLNRRSHAAGITCAPRSACCLLARPRARWGFCGGAAAWLQRCYGGRWRAKAAQQEARGRSPHARTLQRQRNQRTRCDGGSSAGMRCTKRIPAGRRGGARLVQAGRKSGGRGRQPAVKVPVGDQVHVQQLVRIGHRHVAAARTQLVHASRA